MSYAQVGKRVGKDREGIGKSPAGNAYGGRLKKDKEKG